MTTKQIIRQRLNSAKNIMNITKAMEVVATVQFRKLQHRISTFRFFKDRLAEMVKRLQLSPPEQIIHPLFNVRPVKKTALIIVTGDKGLCGSYNSSVITTAEKFLNERDPESVSLFLLGKKGVDFFSTKKWPIQQSEDHLARVFSEETVKVWSENYLKSFILGDFDEMWIVYTHFYSIIKRETRIAKILPMVTENEIPTKAEIEKPMIDFIFEPSSTQIYNQIIPFFFEVQLEALLLESYASELSSRMVAMKSSAKNAEEMIEKLTLVKNKLRQLSITNEILEITAGAESLK